MNSKKQYSNGNISRKDFHYLHEKTLRDLTPSSNYYIAGLIDADGYFGKSTIEITMHAKEEFLLHKIKALYGGSVSKKSDNYLTGQGSRYRISKNRQILINNVYDKVLTIKKIDQLNKYYNIQTIKTVNDQYFSY
jgi:hypothetical protein